MSFRILSGSNQKLSFLSRTLTEEKNKAKLIVSFNCMVMCTAHALDFSTPLIKEILLEVHVLFSRYEIHNKNRCIEGEEDA